MIIKYGKELDDYISQKVNKNWNKRDFVNVVQDYWKSSTDFILCIGGLRGMGKTIGLLQAATQDSVYICLQKNSDNTYVDSTDKILKAIKDSNCKKVIIDEYTWVSDRKSLSIAIYTLVQNGYRVVITGTNSMTMEYLNHGELIHRVRMIHCNYFSYDEYIRINHLIPSTKVLDMYLEIGGIFKEYAIDNFDSMTKYIKEGIIDDLVNLIGDNADDKITAAVYNIFYKAICQSFTGEESVSLENAISLSRFTEIMGISPETSYDSVLFNRVLSTLERIEVLVKAENIDESNANKQRWYITNPSLNYQLYQIIYDKKEPGQLLGHVFEAICVAHFVNRKNKTDKLYFLKGNSKTSKEYEIDFVILNEDSEPQNCKYVYLFECKHDFNASIKQGASIKSAEVDNYFPNASEIGRYVIYRGDKEIVKHDEVGDIIFAPLNSSLPQEYYNFSQHVEELSGTQDFGKCDGFYNIINGR